MMPTLAKRLFANKFLLTATTITTTIIFFILIVSSSPQRQAIDPSSTPSSNTTQINNPFSEFTNLTEERVNNAISYRKLIENRLPIYLSKFKTKSKIETTISISIHPTEPSITRLDISGLSYLNKNELDPTKNPNVSAFQDSFQKALQLMHESGIEPKQLLFSYGEADYVKVAATEWVDKLGLLR